MDALTVTVSLAIHCLLFAIAVGVGIHYLRMGRHFHDRHTEARGVFWLLFPTALLSFLIWIHVAYLWTETLWFQQFLRLDDSNAGYDTVFWSILRYHWRIFAVFTLAGGLFISLNVWIAKRVCPVQKEFEQWTFQHSRLIHRFLFLAAFGSSALIALFLMGRWDIFTNYLAYRDGVGRVPAIVEIEPALTGNHAHPTLPLKTATRFRTDLKRFDDAFSRSVRAGIRGYPLIRLYDPAAITPGHRPENPHFQIRGYLHPLERNEKGIPSYYRVSVALSGPTILERVAPRPSLPVYGEDKGGVVNGEGKGGESAEEKRRVHTGENYVKYESFEAEATPGELPSVASALFGRLLESKYLKNGFSDPIFHKNVGYYLFEYPAMEWGMFWVKGMLWLALAVVGWQYRFYYHRDSQSMSNAIVGIETQGSLLWMGLLGMGIWGTRISAQDLLYALPSFIKSGRVPRGISYIDFAQIEAFKVYVVLLAILMFVLLVNLFLRDRRVWIGVAGAWAVGYVGILWAYPSVVYFFRVRPNPLRAERVFLENHIAFTRRAFNLDSIEPSNVIRKLAQYEDIIQHGEVLRNVQLWDRRVIWERLQQSHAIQRYYEFNPNPDVDRYQINGQLRQVVLAGREVNPKKLQTQDWVSKRLKYTHGYGVVLAPVNEAVDPGVPNFWVKGIPPQPPGGDGFKPLAINRPEIYFGEVDDEYAIVKSEELEVDHPIEKEFAYTRYEGHGGIPIGSWLQRLAFATRLREPIRVGLSPAVNRGSRVLMRRKVLDRIQAVAPFLKFDPDPFLVIGKETGRLWWIIDAYTVSTYYPYAQVYRQLDANGEPIKDLGGEFAEEPEMERFNYIRNSAVAVVDAYNGDVHLYATDPGDPLMQVYMRLFPKLFQPIDAMPDEMRTHLRYPDYLVWVQATMYALYHVTDPVIFTTGADAWKLPREKFHTETLVPMLPYYTVLTLPGAEKPEFVSILPFSPPATTKRLTAWLVARSDKEHYGNLTCYELQRREEVDGPEQIENRIDQDTELSEKFTLLGQGGSEVIRGNLLLLPVRTRSGEDALFYVEPVYLRATGEQGTSMPELKFVVVVADDKLGADTSMESALRDVFRIGLSGIIQGKVVDANNNPVGGATVALTDEQGQPLPNPPKTEPDGSYRVEMVMMGTYKANIAVGGFLPFENTLAVQPGLATTFNAVLQPKPVEAPKPRSIGDMATSANDALNRYSKLVGEGKFVEAAQALEQARRELQSLNESTKKQ